MRFIYLFFLSFSLSAYDITHVDFGVENPGKENMGELREALISIMENRNEPIRKFHQKASALLFFLEIDKKADAKLMVELISQGELRKSSNKREREICRILVRWADKISKKSPLCWYLYDLAYSLSEEDYIKEKRDSKWIESWEGILDTPKWIFEYPSLKGGSEVNTPVAFPPVAEEIKGAAESNRSAVRKHSAVSGLVVSQLNNGRMIGTSAEINATVISHSGEGCKFSFARPVGRSMRLSLLNAMAALKRRYPYLADKQEVVISFTEKFSQKDGNSAGAAMTLLLLSLFDGFELDESTVVTGAICQDWTVHTVGGVPEKVRGAYVKGAKIAVIPRSNDKSASDMSVLYHLSTIWRIQIFAAENLEQVLALAAKKKGAKEANAIERFEKLAKIFEKGPSALKGKKSEIVAELQEILKLTPNHLSAEFMLKKLTERKKVYLSDDASVDLIFRIADKSLNYHLGMKMAVSQDALKRDMKKIKTMSSKVNKDVRVFYGGMNKFIASLLSFRDLYDRSISSVSKNTLKKKGPLTKDQRLKQEELKIYGMRKTKYLMLEKRLEKIRENRSELQKRWTALRAKLKEKA